MTGSIPGSRIWISTGDILLCNVMVVCDVSGSFIGSIAVLCLNMMVGGLEFFLRWINQDPGPGGTN